MPSARGISREAGSWFFDIQEDNIFYKKNWEKIWRIESKAFIFASAFNKQLFLKRSGRKVFPRIIRGKNVLKNIADSEIFLNFVVRKNVSEREQSSLKILK